MEERRITEKHSRACIVLDTSALLTNNLVGILQGYHCFTVPDVLEEVKSLRHMISVEVLLDLKALRVVEPDNYYIEKILEAAMESGDITSLSRTDVKVLALALQLQAQGLNPILMTDDYSVQNLASRFKVGYRSVKVSTIKKRIKWRYRCTACSAIYDKYAKTCAICGHKLKREIARYEDL
ncbi:MAG: hypothetical protein QW701_05200 [Candidatus Nezhaarchaeales archaeon]